MDTQVLSPTPGQTIVATETHRGHGHDQSQSLREQISRDFIATTQQIRAEFNTSIDQVRTGFTAQALANCKTDDGIAAAVTSTLVGFKDLTALSYQVEGRSLLEAAKNASLLGIQADKNFYATDVAAVKNAAAAAMQLAECCCELKALIVSDGNTTRALINQGTVDGLRAQLATAQSTSAAFFARNVAPVVPIT